MQKIFISYSRKDIDIARKLAGDLEGIGYDVWWDITDLRGGDDWVKTLPAEIAAAKHFILILTPNSVNSKWVQKEYTQALNLQKKIIPLMFELCGVPFALNDINYIDFMGGEYAGNFKNLLNALGYKGKPPVVTPFERATTILRPATRKYAIPAVTAIVTALLILAATFIFSPKSVTPLPTQSLVPIVETKTEPITLTPGVNVTDTPLSIATETPTPITLPLTPSATKQPFETLTYCVNSLYAFTINVRSGPGTNHAVLGEPLPLRRCLTFRGVNEDDSWLLIAQDQEDPRNTQYEGGWIFRELLGLGLVGPIDLPFLTLTATPTESPTPTITLSPTLTPTKTPSPTLSSTKTPSPTEAPADTLEPTNTLEPTATPTP